MKNKRRFISIFILMISMLACCFIFADNKIVSVSAAGTQQDCYYLLDQDGNTYQANSAVGKVDGLGQFVVGEENITLTATANANFQLVGWKIIYSDQIDKTEFVDTSNLEMGKKQIVLTAKDGQTQISANIEFISKNNIYQSGTFTLARVFENLIVRPVFNHVYYSVDISELAQISTLSSTDIGADTLFYETETTDGEVTTYSNAYVKMGEEYFFYGELYLKNGKYYTIHETLTDEEAFEEVDYTCGAFRVGDEVAISLNVDIIADKLKESKNIDFISASIIGGSSVALVKDATENGYYIEQDQFLRTTNYGLTFDVIASNNQKNIVDITYHNLYVVDLQINIDGNSNHNEIGDVFGEISIQESDLVSNITINNFYARTNENNLQFLVKKAQDNASRSFRVSSSQNINKNIDGVSYKYYQFVSLDNMADTTQSYGNINSNITIIIDYSSEMYQITFASVEYIKGENDDVVLNSFVGDVLDPIVKKRGETVDLNLASAQNIENVGYSFKGYATSLDGTVEESLSYTINLTKPQGATIYMLFEKISYEVVFTNYNQVQLDSTNPLNSVTFTIVNGVFSNAQTFTQAELVGESVKLSNILKIGGMLAVEKVVNPGFNILGFSTKGPQEVTDDDYFTELSFDAKFIKENNIEDKIIIYVYEDLVKYTITYYTEPTHDTSLDQNVVMAQLSATSSTGTISRYDISDQLIADDDVDAVVAKIVVSGLKLNDQVVLSSIGVTVGEGEDAYSYVFNWFTEDDKSTLSYVKNDNTYSHTETVIRSREIKVVYSMPTTRVMIAIEEEYALNENFQCLFKVESEGTRLVADENTNNVFTMDVGETITITLSDLSFGYTFVGYKIVEENTIVKTNSLTFDYVTTVGINTLELDFERIKYHFLFRQYGADKQGDIVTFDGKTYVELDVDNTSAVIEKPLGYYVSSVKFNETHDEYSAKISEDNDYRLNGDISKFYFVMERQDFVNVITNYGILNSENIAEINVRLDYTIFTYRVQVQYGLTNPKGDNRDDYVVYPEIELKYELNNQTKFASTEAINGQKGVAFVGIPYGAKATMNLLGGATAGLSLSGWAYTLDNRVSQDEHVHSLEYLIVANVVDDNAFLYLLTYNAYQINVVYDAEQGNPSTYINNVLANGTVKQITLYDKLAIVANASRNNGYVFDKITYEKPVYTQYVYSQETWDLRYASLYVVQGDGYKLNTSETYDPNVIYYLYSTETQICDSETFEDDSFMVSDYALGVDGKTITFVVEYKLLQLSVVNFVEESRELYNEWGWTLQGRGFEDAKINIDLSEMALFEVTATASDGTQRSIDQNSTVNYYDTISVVVKINTKAKNFDAVEYDLSLGLELVRVSIFGELVGFVETNTREYKLTFYVGDHMPAEGENLDILYTLEMQAKNVYVTTIVQNSTTFYDNTTLSINAFKYGFYSSVITSTKGKKSLSQDFQFLSKATVSTFFTTDQYKDNFIVSGVKIYCDGVLIPVEEYGNYGIVVSEDNSVTARLFRDLDVEFIVQPKITYNEGPIYSKIFECDILGNGLPQKLTVGNSSASDIQVADMIVDAISISYLSTEPNSFAQSDVTNVGRYKVLISFAEVEDFDWLDEITVAENVTLIIQPKDLYVTYNIEAIETVSKVYDKTSDYNVVNIYKYLIFTDNKAFTVNYADIMDQANNNLTITNASAYISSDGKGTMIASANESIYYNLYVYNITLKNTQYNNNFNLQTTDLTIYNYIQIARRELKLQNIQVYCKVYDGTDTAEIVSTENITVSNIIAGDDIAINMLKLNPRFEDSSIGTNKKVIVNATNALIGADIGNYYVKSIETKGLTIYPYSLSVNIRGVGQVEVINERGLTEKDKVSLIPLNATLKVSVIQPDSQEYVSIYSRISKHIKGNNEFAIGYEIAFIINGEEFAVNNNLYLSIPNVKNVTGSYYLTGQQSGGIRYTYKDGNMLIDLSQIDENVNQIFFTKTKILLKAWQLVLIIIGGLLIIAGVVLILIILRKRKVDRDSVHEKI